MLYEIKAVIPPKEIIEYFERKITPFFDQIASNQKEKNELVKLQDILLSELTS